jgi:hypothetical protein
MGLLSLFRTKASEPQGAPEPGSPETPDSLWRKTDLTSFSAGEETHIVYARSGPPITLPAFAIEFVLSCSEFKPLDAHLSAYAEKHGWHSLQLDALRQHLPRMIASGVLVSSLQLHARCAAMCAGAAPAPIDAIGFPTGGDRTPLLARAVESFAANLRTHGRRADFIVADNSTQPEHRAGIRAKAEELSRTLDVPIYYSGETERRRFAEALVRRSGCRADSVEFALFDPLGIGFSCGANRNALLLHEAGRMFCSVDDDVICRLAEPPELREARLSMFSNTDPFSRWLFADRESALAAGHFVERDFLAEHEHLLGRDVGALFADGIAEHEIDLTDTGDDLLRRLELGDARVRTTFLGHLGDPGIPSSCYFLYYERENLRRLIESEAHYLSVFGSRSVLTSVLTRTIGDASVSPGMAMGLDHRELLPPFFPVLHAEDFAFGATAWQCCPGAVAGHLPLTVLHQPPTGKSILQPSDLSAENRVVIFEFAHVLTRLILDFVPAQHATAAERTIALGRHLTALATQPAADFIEALRETILKHESEKLGYLETLLADETDAPDYWRHDLETFLQHAREALSADDFDIPYDLKAHRTPEQNRVLMQQLIARYGQLLIDWPAIVTTATELRKSGTSPAARI